MSTRPKSSRKAKTKQLRDEETDDDYVEERPAKRSRTTGSGTSSKNPTKKGEASDAVPSSTQGFVFDHSLSLHKPTAIAPLLPNLLKWFAGTKSARKMPWRKEYDASLSREEKSQRAYEVLVSEVMLQQTQVATVISYFDAWLERFPTIKDLAAVDDIEEVNKLWKGLGYYRRASSLLQAAKKIVGDFDGYVPDDVKIMEKEIPGVGRYTAGAVCSIAYNVNAPAVDGNVFRLFSRLLALHANPKSKAFQDIIWEATSTLVDKADRPGDVNQAFIELGSTVCKVSSPACGGCPLREGCGAYQQQRALPDLPLSGGAIQDIEDACTICEPFESSTKVVTRYPMKAVKKAPREERMLITVIESKIGDERWLLMSQRPNKGLLAGLWEFPTSPMAGIVSAKEQLLASKTQVAQWLPDISKETAMAARVIGEFLHLFSHIRQTNHVTHITLENATLSDEVKGRKWIRWDEFETMNVGMGTTKAWGMIQSA